MSTPLGPPSTPTGDGTAVRLLGGRYALGPLLGVGGMAEVLEGTDVRLGRTVALKVLRPELARDPSFQARFRREAQAAASLNDPAIVSVYDTGTDDAGVPFIVMERVEGRTLREVLQQEGRLLPQRALEVVADVCGALQVAHEAGIVHRDVKPGNVMLTPGGSVKVMDFGIARAVADSAMTMTETSAVIGTAAYLSPEQARGEHVDARSDLYSTGCLLYELVTGAPPFTGDSPVAVAYQHVREDPVLPTAFDASLSPDVDAVVLKAMSKNPANRYQSAADMRDDLLRAAAGEPVAATPVLVEDSSGTRATTIVPAASTSRRRIEPSTTKRAVVYSVFGAVLLALLLFTALLVRGLLASDSELVPAPELVGLSQQQAVSELADAGLKVGQVRFEFQEKPAGTVLGQTPNDGIVVPRDGSIDLVVSKGVDLTALPMVLGLDRDAAAALLERYRLSVGEVSFRDGNIPPGQVLAVTGKDAKDRTVDLKPGTAIRAGRSVDLVVASGRVEVPDVRGLAQDEAVGKLRAAGLSVAVQPVDDPGPPGRVIEQDPSGGTRERSSVVRIGVSQVPPPPPPTQAPQPVTPQQPTTAPTQDPVPPPSVQPTAQPTA
ncbi:MAG: serine/threonine protein kinase [Frankiales bacterium]|nr:serine/threonine protein kinase [Frankiales bacterium]